NASGPAGFGFYTASGTASAVVTIKPDQDYPCRSVAYGTRCGASLEPLADFTYPGTTLFTIRDAHQPANAWFLLGDQKLAAPVGPCILYDNMLVMLPAFPVAAGVFERNRGLGGRGGRRAIEQVFRVKPSGDSRPSYRNTTRDHSWPVDSSASW